MLFAIYIEELLEELESSGQRALVNEQRIAVIAYADDVMLLSNDDAGCRRLIQIAEEYGKKVGVKWNPLKTQLLVVGRPKR